MKDNEKIKRTKKEIKSNIFLWSFYLAIVIIALIEYFFDKNVVNNSILILLLILAGITIYGLTYQIFIFSSEEKIRKKAINIYDERLREIKSKTNSQTLKILISSLFILLLLFIAINQFESFATVLLILFLFIIVYFICSLFYKNKI
jgi:glucan phosphoethanolaminetransferase (alkaline phosphatase superfamily)